MSCVKGGKAFITGGNIRAGELRRLHGVYMNIRLAMVVWEESQSFVRSEYMVRIWCVYA